MTIAPIAPTLLKTTPLWTENFGDESSDDNLSGWGIGAKVGAVNHLMVDKEEWNRDKDCGIQRRRRWSSGYDMDGYGFAPGAFGTGHDVRGMGFGAASAPDSNDDGHGSDGTPVELVYVPPFEYEYSEQEAAESVVLGGKQEPRIGANVVEQFEDIEEQIGHQETLYHQLTVNGSAIHQLVENAVARGQKSNGSQVPTVVVEEEVASFSHQGLSRREVEDNLDEETDSKNDYFGGPDMGNDNYYACRGYAESDINRISQSKPSSRMNYGFGDRQRARDRERRNAGSGQERQSRSRSRSQSRTPSPALMSSANSPDASPDGATITTKQRIPSGSSPLTNGILSSSRRNSSNSDLLSPFGRGRQPDPSYGARSIKTLQEDRRGRSSTRNSSSSLDRERGSYGSIGSTSPIGSLSPDEIGSPVSGRTSSTVGAVLGVVLGGGRAEKERDGERRDIHRRGRERTKSKHLAATANPPSGLRGNAEEVKHSNDVGVCFFSTTSSSSSSTSSTIIAKQTPAYERDDYTHLPEDVTRSPTPTPWNSPSMDMTISSSDTRSGLHSASATVGTNTPTQNISASLSDRNVSSIDKPTTISSDTLDGMPFLPPSLLSSGSTTSLSHPISKFRPPSTLILQPSAPAKPSTSFTAAVSPTTSCTTLMGTTDGANADSTIVGKAVDIMSSAGIYLGWWNRERSTSASSGPSSN